MDQHTDLLAAVVAELERRKGELTDISKGSGVAYDTVHRIKNRENDPGYSKVRKLADYLGIKLKPSTDTEQQAAA